MILISLPAFGAEFFTNSNLMDLNVVEVDSENGRAWIKDKNNSEMEVYLGDLIGVNGCEILKIGETSITVKNGNVRTIMPINSLGNIQLFDKQPGDGFPTLR